MFKNVHPWAQSSTRSFLSKPKADFKFSFTDPFWYGNKPLGVNQLSKIMKEMCLGGKLLKTCTNHCYLLSHSGLTRAFQLITLWVFQAMSMSRGLWYFICRQVFAFLCKSAWYGSVLVTEMHIIETHPLKNVDNENANKWKITYIECQSRNPQRVYPFPGYCSCLDTCTIRLFFKEE